MAKIIEFYYDKDYGITTIKTLGLGYSKKKTEQLERHIKKAIDNFLEN